MCENVFQYMVIDRGLKNKRAIFKTDIPYGTTMYSDLREYIQQSPYRNSMYSAFIGEFYSSMGSFAVDDTTKLSFCTFAESNRYFYKKYKGKNCATYLCYNIAIVKPRCRHTMDDFPK